MIRSLQQNVVAMQQPGRGSSTGDPEANDQGSSPGDTITELMVDGGVSPGAFG